MKKQFQSFAGQEDQGDRQLEEQDSKISRRKLLASIGIAGVGMAAGTLFNSGVGFAKPGGSVTETVLRIAGSREGG